MKKLISILLCIFCLIVFVVPTCAEEIDDISFEVLSSVDGFTYKSTVYHKDEYLCNGELQIVLINENEVIVMDSNYHMLGYQNHAPLERFTFSELEISNVENNYQDKSIKRVAPSMYNRWTEWTQVTNTYMSFNLNNFVTVSALASAMFSKVKYANVISKYLTWYSVAASWSQFLATPITKTVCLWRRTNLDCRYVVKESALSTNSLRDSDYNVTWLADPWVYIDDYPYACRYLWDKDL